MVNPSETTPQLQAAIKNFATNSVFYFVLPLDIDCLLVASTVDVNSFASSWKSFDETSEVSVVLKGTIMMCDDFGLIEFHRYVKCRR
jgi:hypothetical protein